MADGDMMDGITSDFDGEVEIDESPKDREMGIKRLKELENKNAELERENNDMRDRIGDLNRALDTARNEETKVRERLGEMEIKIQQFDSDKRSLDAMAARAQQLEIENSRLSEDLSLTTVVDGEVERLKDLLEEKVKRIETLENEKTNAEVVSKATIVEKDREMWSLRKQVEELELVIAENRAESENFVGYGAEYGMMNVGELDPRILNGELEPKGILHGLRQRATHWPSIVVSAGAVTAIAIGVYVRYAKLRRER